MSRSLAGALGAGTSVYWSIPMKMKAVGAVRNRVCAVLQAAVGASFASMAAPASIARRLATSAARRRRRQVPRLPAGKHSARSDPRGGCDAGTPIAPENRGFPGGRSGLFPDPLSGVIDGSYVSALVNGTKGLRRIACDWGCDGRCDGACDRVTTIESQSSAALSVSSRTGMSVSTVVLRPPDRSQPSRVAALPDPLLAAP